MKDKDYSLHEKILAKRARAALKGKTSYLFYKHEVERTYDIEQYSDYDKDGKIITTYRKIRVSPSSQSNRKTVQENIFVKDLKDQNQAYKAPQAKERKQNAIKHMINVVCDKNENTQNKITVLKQLIHNASYKSFYDEIPQFIKDNNMQEQLNECLSFANENIKEIKENPYFKNQDDVTAMFNILQKLCLSVQSEETEMI